MLRTASRLERLQHAGRGDQARLGGDQIGTVDREQHVALLDDAPAPGQAGLVERIAAVGLEAHQGSPRPKKRVRPEPCGAGRSEGYRDQRAGRWLYCGTRTIHATPKRSVTMPKRGEKKVLLNGAVTCPPSDSAANSRLASASSRAVIVRLNPWNTGLPLQ